MNTASADSFSLAGQLALITGGGSGIGFGIAQCFIRAGARVVLVGRNEERLTAAVEQLGTGAHYKVCDIARLNSIPQLIDEVHAQEGRISLLVNNAGNHLKKAAAETSDIEFDNIVETHLRASFALSREVAREMLKSGGGSILFIASMASLMGIPLVVAYSAAKTAICGLVRALAAEWSPRGIRVNAIAPGWIDTAMLRTALTGDPSRAGRILARTPMARFGNVEDIGMAAIYLSSPAARFITGVVLPVDGGASIGF
jgi:gluconate 5-dehydrogenase